MAALLTTTLIEVEGIVYIVCLFAMDAGVHPHLVWALGLGELLMNICLAYMHILVSCSRTWEPGSRFPGSPVPSFKVGHMLGTTYL